MTITAGRYKAKGVKGSAQLGETEKGTLQIAIDLDVKDAAGESLGNMTTFLYFSPDAKPYSLERLRALGWTKNEDEIDNMDGIDTNDVDVEVKKSADYTGTDGTAKTGSLKIEILTGGGKVTLNKPLDGNTFKARLKALGGSSGGGGTAPAAGGGTAPPF